MIVPRAESAFCFSTLFLLGMRACGKTSLGGVLAKRLGYAFTDTDELVRQEAGGLEVADIVRIEGWEGFRAREALALRAAAAPFTVVATGGGIVLSSSNREFLRESGLCVYLAAPASVLRDRLRLDPAPAQRPPLFAPAGSCALAPHPADEVEAVLRERDPLYREVAHHTIPAERSVADLVDLVSDLAEFPLRRGERNL